MSAGKTNVSGSALKKKKGTITVSNLAPNAQQYFTITFDKPFSKIPDVALQSTYPVAVGGYSGITTSGFTVLVSNYWDQTISWALQINWIAVGE